jgi:hypothetical protein
MPLTCNINARGKLVRLWYGIALVVIGLILLFVWALPKESVLAWAVTGLCILGGGFAIFESRKGWCILRAMGMKTPI